MPARWHLNTCLVNFYGSRLESGKRVDTARVGEHKDFEPGPVASISPGRAGSFSICFQPPPGKPRSVIFQQWLDDGSLQVFGTDRWKKQLFHRVQRVDKREGFRFPLQVENFETRRINFTFRYVPDEHIIPFAKLPAPLAKDVQGYMVSLASRSRFFETELMLAKPKL